MKAVTVAGLVLVVLGTALLLTGGFSYKKDDTVLDAAR
jgi:hypothetical protein